MWHVRPDRSDGPPLASKRPTATRPHQGRARPPADPPTYQAIATTDKMRETRQRQQQLVLAPGMLHPTDLGTICIHPGAVSTATVHETSAETGPWQRLARGTRARAVRGPRGGERIPSSPPHAQPRQPCPYTAHAPPLPYHQAPPPNPYQTHHTGIATTRRIDDSSPPSQGREKGTTR